MRSGKIEKNLKEHPEMSLEEIKKIPSVLNDPVLVERVEADAGLDIGDTLIGMHLRRVAVPVRLENGRIGQAHVTAALTRPPLIGGARARYE